MPRDRQRLGADAVARPRRRRASGSVASSSAVVAASASTWRRARSSAASTSRRPCGAIEARCEARLAASGIVVRWRTVQTLAWPSDGSRGARLRPAAGADRAASGRAARRVAAARLRPGDGRGPAPRRSRELPEELHGELVVVNDTRVVPARIPIEHAARGGAAARAASRTTEWEALARPTRRLKAGRRVRRRSSCSSTSARGAGACGSTASRTARRRCRRTSPRRSPTRRATRPSTRTRPGRAAAPTAGLHFTPELLAQLDVDARHAPRRPRHVPARQRADARGAPHPRRALRGRAGAWERIRAADARPRRRHDDGAHARDARPRAPLAGRTELFITPGFEFRRVDALLTNFHLPRSTLLALVMAFAGVEETRALYRDCRRGALPLLLLRRCDADPVRPRARTSGGTSGATAASASSRRSSTSSSRTASASRRCSAATRRCARSSPSSAGSASTSCTHRPTRPRRRARAADLRLVPRAHERLHARAHRRRRARRHAAHCARRRPHADVHAGRDEGDGEVGRPRRAARASARR